MANGKPINLPFEVSRRNLWSNIAINSAFGLGIYFLYKDYKSSDHKRTSDRATRPVTQELPDPITQTPTSVHGPLARRNISYRELSFATVGYGFVMQLANMAHVTYDKKSLSYKAGLASVILYPPLLYYLYAAREPTH
ncbi:LAFA_0G04566g1_1 [Lachancea sp. 'fantastica']|nr:LAFA_0G04566g1_1 [Lachancea sp. 'fantastica']